MLDFLDTMLRRLLITRVAGITDVTQVRFQPPDQDWRTYVSNLAVGGVQVNALNVYLVDLRENRGLRSNERVREYVNGTVEETPAPRRMTCHYLITAWSPANVTPAIEPSLDEHLLLYQVTAALTDAEPLVASEIYAPGPLPAGFPALIAEAELPTVVLPAEGFPKYAEFWGTMGVIHPWKPAVYLEVTIPVQLRTEIVGPIVTTRITEYRTGNGASAGETWIQIGGTVLDPAARPVPNAWVRLETTAGLQLHHLASDALGRFTFSGLHPGSYRLHVRAAGLGDKTRTVDVPSDSGEYDLSYP